MKNLLKLFLMVSTSFLLIGCDHFNPAMNKKIAVNNVEIVDTHHKESILDIIEISNRNPVKTILSPAVDAHDTISVGDSVYYIYYGNVLDGVDINFEISEAEYSLIMNGK